MNGKEASLGTSPLVFLCAGNGNPNRYSLILENLLLEYARVGYKPLLLHSSEPPFGGKPTPDKRLGRWFDSYSEGRITGLRSSKLDELLSDRKKRETLAKSGTSFGPVFIQAPSPDEVLSAGVDSAVFFTEKNVTAAGWVYNQILALQKIDPAPAVSVLLVNANHLEEAAAFFFELRQEMQGLLKNPVSFSFAGFVRVEPEYLEVSTRTEKPLAEILPEGAFHGQLRYVVKALERTEARFPETSFFNRLVPARERAAPPDRR